MKGLLLCLFICFLQFSFAQKYGNEWIKYGQTYYKFPILQTGFYKIDYNTLTNANVPLNTLNSAHLQVFGREKEQPLYMVDGNDNVFGPGDYFLFYAEANDGWLDSTLFKNPQGIGNPGYSLYNDTLFYFFSWNTSSPTSRFEVSEDTTFSNYLQSEYIMWTQFHEFHNEYFEGRTLANISSSFYNDGEGYVRSKAYGPFNQDLNFNTAHRYVGPDAPAAVFQGKSYSRNNPAISGSDQYNHHSQWKLVHSGSTLMDSLYYDIKAIDFRKEILTTELVNGTTVFRYVNVGDLPSGNDLQGMSYARLYFPKIPNFSGFSSGKFKVNNAFFQSKIRLQLSQVEMPNPMFFSLGSNPQKLNLVSNGGSNYQVLIPNSSLDVEQEIVYGSENNLITIGSMQLVNSTGQFTDFSQQIVDSALLFVYHQSLTQATNNYEIYRESPQGGSYSVIKANIDELYLQFGGGVPKHINGVRRWSQFIYDQSNKKPSGLFLIGKGIREAPYDSYPFQSLGTRGNSAYYAQSLIPSFGQPSSDMAITASWVPNNWSPFIQQVEFL
jgi:hypothetical protein